MQLKDNFLQRWEREFNTTIKVLKAYPEHRKDFKPHEKSRSAIELAAIFAVEEILFIQGVVNNKITFNPSPTLKTMSEVISEFERVHKETVEKFKTLSEETLNETIPFHAGPGKMHDFKKIDICNMALMDSIHHRGQFSVYLRMVDGKVPSIYGPSADDNWM